MSETTKSTTTTKAPTAASAPAAAEADPGYIGIAVDPTPNENYTLQGVTSGAPTPETDADAKAAAEANQKKVEQQVAGTSGNAS